MNSPKDSADKKLSYDEFSKLPLTTRLEMVNTWKAPKKPETSLALIPVSQLQKKIIPVENKVRSIISQEIQEKNNKYSINQSILITFKKELALHIKWPERIIDKLSATQDINIKDENWKTILYYICYYWIDSLVWLVLQYNNLRNDYVLWKDVFHWLENWEWNQKQKDKILKFLKIKFWKE